MVLAVLLRESMTNQLSHANLFSDLSNVTLRRVFRTDQGWTIEADGQDSAVCPGCQSISHSRHSRYWRSLNDLPVQGTPVILRLHLGRWRCRNAELPAANLHRTSLQGLRPICTADQANRRDHRRGGACPGRTSRPTLDEQARHTGQRRYADPPSQKSGTLASVAPGPRPWCR